MLILLIFILNIKASTLIKIEQDEVFKRAEYILSATVKDIECKLEYSNEYSYLPYSYIALNIEEIHHNNQQKPLYVYQDIMVRQVGCNIGYKSDSDIILHIDGLSDFTIDTKIFLSLNEYKNPNFQDYYLVTANEQGKLDYENNNTLIQDLDHSKYIRTKNGNIKFLNTNPSIKSFSKEKLIKLIKTVKGE